MARKNLKATGPQHDTHVLSYYIINILSYRDRATEYEIDAGRAWYPGMRAKMDTFAEDTGLSPDQCADIFAATSINTPWVRNVAIATGWLNDYMHGVMPTGNHLGNVVKMATHIINGERLTDIIKDANKLKIRNFSRNLVDDADYLTVDRWAHRVAYDFSDCPNTDNRDDNGIPHGCTKNGKHGCGTVPEGEHYETIALAYRMAAHMRGDRPLDIQAITWCVARKSED